MEYTPDGRSLVKTIGERRFRVVRRDVVDGYHLAWVEFVFDERVTDKSKIGEHITELFTLPVVFGTYGYSWYC